MRVILSEDRLLDAYNKVVVKLREIFYSDVSLNFKKATITDKIGYVGNIVEWTSNKKSGWHKMSDFLKETDIPRIFHLEAEDLHRFKKLFRGTDGKKLDLYDLAALILRAKTATGRQKSNDC